MKIKDHELIYLQAKDVYQAITFSTHWEDHYRLILLQEILDEYFNHILHTTKIIQINEHENRVKK